MTTSNGLPILLTANLSEGTLDACGPDLTLLAQFADPTASVGYAPSNVLFLDCIVYVTFAKQDAGKEDDVPGRGNEQAPSTSSSPKASASGRFRGGTRKLRRPGNGVTPRSLAQSP